MRALLAGGLIVATLGVAFLVGRTAAERGAPAADERPPALADAVLAHMEVVLQRDGLSAALDSLEHRAERDSSLARDGHQMAHALGREAVALHGGDPSVVRECRPAFASGCYHGVVEAALRAAGRIDMRRLERLCTGLADSAVPGPGFECIHGVGHGVLGARHYDLGATLRDCDALSTPRRATSCHLGAFMEAVNVALGVSAASPAAYAGMHHEHAAAPPLTIDPADPYSPCQAFPDPYAGSCWLFQGFVILRSVGFDPERALQVCDGAPEGRAPRCYEGIGHQITGLFQRGDAWVLQQCGRGQAALTPHCAAGATLALDAMDWTGGRAARFCAAARPEWKDACYRAAAGALVDLATASRRTAFCASVEPSFTATCREAAGLAAAVPTRHDPASGRAALARGRRQT